MQTINWDAITVEPMSELITRQMWNGEHATVARVVLLRGAVVARHSHPSEQFSMVLSGALEFELPDGKHLVRTGEMLYIPQGVPHAAVALEDTIDIDVFSPRREDWIRGDDAYLRGSAQPGSGSR
jgi:quercetin dioxygenase-like cupin family protein